jgi:hypothetical protein
MWCRAGGPDWAGVNLSSAQNLNLFVCSNESMVLQIILKDKNNNPYLADTLATKGGQWENMTIPLDSFELQPYYKPPDAVKNAPKDFSKVAIFNIQPKTVGKFSFAIDHITAQ